MAARNRRSIVRACWLAQDVFPTKPALYDRRKITPLHHNDQLVAERARWHLAAHRQLGVKHSQARQNLVKARAYANALCTAIR